MCHVSRITSDLDFKFFLSSICISIDFWRISSCKTLRCLVPDFLVLVDILLRLRIFRQIYLCGRLWHVNKAVSSCVLFSCFYWCGICRSFQMLPLLCSLDSREKMGVYKSYWRNGKTKTTESNTKDAKRCESIIPWNVRRHQGHHVWDSFPWWLCFSIGFFVLLINTFWFFMLR